MSDAPAVQNRERCSPLNARTLSCASFCSLRAARPCRTLTLRGTTRPARNHAESPHAGGMTVCTPAFHASRAWICCSHRSPPRRAQVNEWFLENRDPLTGAFPDFPAAEAGGSRAIIPPALQPTLLPPPPPQQQPAAPPGGKAKAAVKATAAPGRPGRATRMSLPACHGTETFDTQGGGVHAWARPHGFCRIAVSSVLQRQPWLRN